jgi:hypothetical protein
MSEFKHWLDESSDASDFERAVLRSGVDPDPSEAQRDEVWTRVLGSLSLAPLGATASHSAALEPTAPAVKAATGAAKAGAVWLGVGKGFVVGLALYGAVTGVSEISVRSSAQRRGSATSLPIAATVHADRDEVPPGRGASAAAAPSEPPTAPAPSSSESAGRATAPAVPSAQERLPPAQTPEAPAVAVFADPPPTPNGAKDPRASQLKAEARALREARAELRSGQLSNAFATLEASRREFSAPELYQEREALLIELLYRSGQVAAAAQRAKAFLDRFPESPHAGQVQQFAAQR